MINNTQTVEDWVAALDMKRHGSEWKSPCPVCGGDNRFHVKQGHSQVLAYCRHGCSSHQELREAVFGKRRPPRRGSSNPSFSETRAKREQDELHIIRLQATYATKLVRQGCGLLSETATAWAKERNLRGIKEMGWFSANAQKLPKPPTPLYLPNMQGEVLVMPYWNHQLQVTSVRFRCFTGPRRGQKLSLGGAVTQEPYNAGLAIRSNGIVLHVTEGESDCEALKASGIGCVVGLTGVQNRRQQKWCINKAKEISRAQVFTWFDRDKPAVAATKSMRKLAHQQGVKFGYLPWNAISDEALEHVKDIGDLRMLYPADLKEVIGYFGLDRVEGGHNAD